MSVFWLINRSSLPILGHENGDHDDDDDDDDVGDDDDDDDDDDDGNGIIESI